jgi:hypothetical protein
MREYRYDTGRNLSREPGTEVEREISDILPSFNFAFEVFASSVCLVPASPSFVLVVTEIVSTSPSKPRLLVGYHAAPLYWRVFFRPNTF